MNQEEQLKVLRERRDAYLHVFGKEGSRTFEQQLVLDDLESLTKHQDTAIVKDAEDRYDSGLTAYKIGLQDVMKRIYLRLNWSEHGNRSRNPLPGSDAASSALTDGGDSSTD